MVVRLGVEDLLSLKREDDQVKDLVGIARLEDVGVLAKVGAIGGHGTEG